MPLLQGVSEIDVNTFNGACLKLDPYSVPITSGLYSQNVSYVRGLVSTRYGHSTVVTITTDGALTSIYNWFFIFGATGLSTVPVSTLTYYAPANGVRIWEQGPSTGFSGIIVPVTGAAGAVFSGAGQRLYMAFYDVTGRSGFGSGYVYGWNIGADPLFASPIANTMAFSEPTTGTITAGAHKFGYLTVTRNGYQGLLQPAADVGGVATFQPVSFTAAGGKNLQVVVSGSIPTYLVGGTMQLVMTTVANPNQYFAVPGAIVTASSSATFIVDISDNLLAQTATDVTAYMDVLTSTVAGIPPFHPSAVFAYSSRMGYVTIDGSGFPVVYISNQNDFQFLTADQHGIYLENQAQPIHCFSLRGVCYIGTQYGFYSVEDNGDVPVTWTPPQLVDGQIGILSPLCVWVNSSAGYAAIASDRGFYIFQGGVFPALPLSYYQQEDWQRINWLVPTTVQVVDDQLNKRFIVLAPLTNTVASVSGSGPYTITTVTGPHLYQTGLNVTINSSTAAITVTGPNTFTFATAPPVGATIYPLTASHEMTWDYTEGDTPETVKYSLNSFANYNAGAVTVMKNLTTSLQEVWYAADTNGPIIRQNDGTEANPYRDVSTAGGTGIISALYETSLIPNSADETSTLHFYHGAHLRVRGNGNLSVLANSVDGTVSTVPLQSPVALTPAPGQELLVKWFLMNEQESIEVGTSALDQWFELALMRVYYTNEFQQR